MSTHMRQHEVSPATTEVKPDLKAGCSIPPAPFQLKRHQPISSIHGRGAMRRTASRRASNGAQMLSPKGLVAFAALPLVMWWLPSNTFFHRAMAAPFETFRPVAPRLAAASSASKPTAQVLTPVQKARQARGRQVAGALERLLRARVSSPGKRLHLVIRAGARADEGYFSEILLSGGPVQVKKLRISELSLRARQVRLDVPALLNEGKIRTLASRSALRAIVTESDLVALLARGRSTRDMKMRVKYLGDRIRVSGNWNWGWLNGPIVGEGRLRLMPGSRVNFDIISLKLNGSELPDFVKTRFSDRINPLLSYEDIPFQPRFRSLQLKGNKAILAA